MQRHRAFAEHMYDALNRLDLETFLAGVDENAEFRSLIAESEGVAFRGHDGVRQWWHEVVEGLGGINFDLNEFEEDGDVAVGQLRVCVRHGGSEIEQRMWQAVQIRDGKTVWWETFRTREEAWAAARERVGGVG